MTLVSVHPIAQLSCTAHTAHGFTPVCRSNVSVCTHSASARAFTTHTAMKSTTSPVSTSSQTCICFTTLTCSHITMHTAAYSLSPTGLSTERRSAAITYTLAAHDQSKLAPLSASHRDKCLRCLIQAHRSHFMIIPLPHTLTSPSIHLHSFATSLC